jgi:hypothetical protein
MRSFMTLVLNCMFILLTFSTGQAQYKIVHGTFGSGGGLSNGFGTALQNTFGQSVIGLAQNDTYEVWSGFWYAVQSNFVTSVESIEDIIPIEFRLDQNYPNPFNPVTVIQYSIPNKSHITIKVFDILGNEIMTLINEEKEAGFHEINFNGRTIVSGMYIYRLIATPDGGQAGKYVSTKKMLLIK